MKFPFIVFFYIDHKSSLTKCNRNNLMQLYIKYTKFQPGYIYSCTHFTNCKIHDGSFSICSSNLKSFGASKKWTIIANLETLHRLEPKVSSRGHYLLCAILKFNAKVDFLSAAKIVPSVNNSYMLYYS